MIFVGKAPYRISLLGGGSDLDWFCKENSYGLSLGFAINMYSYSVLNKLPNSAKFGTINYSSREIYKNEEDIVHPLIREAFKIVKLRNYVEVSSYGSASGGSGLGGSSSFLVSLLSALSKSLNLNWDNSLIAKVACDIEILKLLKPIGRQDQYLSSLGGISYLQFEKDGNVKINQLSNEKNLLLRKLINNFYLIPTNKTRNADQILSSIKNDPSSKSKIFELREIAKDFLDLKETREYVLENIFHESVKESWKIKKNMNNVMNNVLEDQYEFLKNSIPHNWIRLLGAGGGGYFLVSVKEDFKDFDSISNIGKIKVSISETGAESNVF
tara:strand:+ start:113 stop:1093 length:981 start_codon:yes stop_codon:yes gene_type:complete